MFYRFVREAVWSLDYFQYGTVALLHNDAWAVVLSAGYDARACLWVEVRDKGTGTTRWITASQVDALMLEA